MSEPKTFSKLLIDESPLLVIPSLAVALGNVNEAIVLQQVHYLINEKRKNPKKYTDSFHADRWWTWNSYPEWKSETFPWWSVPTIQRIFAALEKRGLLLVSHNPRNTWDQTKWYSVDYDALDNLVATPSIISNCDTASYQIDTMDNVNLIRSTISKCNDDSTKTSTKTLSKDIAATAAPSSLGDEPVDVTPSKPEVPAVETLPTADANSIPPAPPVAWDDIEAAPAASRGFVAPRGKSKDAIERALTLACVPDGDPRNIRGLLPKIRAAGKDIRARDLCSAEDIMARCVGPDALYYTTYLAEDTEGGLTRPPTPQTIAAWLWNFESMVSKRYKPSRAVSQAELIQQAEERRAARATPEGPPPSLFPRIIPAWQLLSKVRPTPAGD